MMPVPAEYQRARDDFYAFLVDLRDAAGLWSTHAAFTVTEGVFRVYRRRVTPAHGLAFAGVLPVGLRALFVADWDLAEPRRPFGSPAEMTAEVRTLRADHNFAPDTAIADVATVLRRHVDARTFDGVLAAGPEDAAAFWRARS